MRWAKVLVLGALLGAAVAGYWTATRSRFAHAIRKKTAAALDHYFPFAGRLLKPRTPRALAPDRRGEPEAPYLSDFITVNVRCDQPTHAISPMIYGLANTKAAPDLYPGAFRLGGNGMSRFNWQLGGVWNTGADYYFENVRLGWTWQDVVDQAHARGVPLSITLPLLGWVAKDTVSSSFPLALFGDQQSVDEWRAGAGNGLSPKGVPLVPKHPSQTSVPATPEYVAEWVKALRVRAEQAGDRARRQYILDNEPGLWNSTHRDVHPEPLTYDELLDRTLRYGTAARTADPDSEIAGPAEWGWSNYFWSAKDAALGFYERPDRRAHGDVPLLEWYLTRLKEYERATGIRILDVVDLHYYPQGRGLLKAGGGGDTDPETALLRIRATRSLWDPSYTDESWIGENIMLLPRLKKLIEENYPGLLISIGEWNFGAEGHISGAIATAESLGRFAQAGIHSAFFWTDPKQGTPAYFAFRAFRNFDGQGARFLDRFVVSESPDDVSAFASTDVNRTQLVLVLINKDPERAKRARVDFGTCGSIHVRNGLVYAGDPAGFRRAEVAGPNSEQMLPPLSISVIAAQLGPR